MKEKNNRSVINAFKIKKVLQLKLVLKMMAIVLTGTLVTSAVFYFYSNREVGASFTAFHIKAENFLDFLLPAILASGVLGILISLIIAVFFPHSLTGPLHRIETDLENMIEKKGDLTFKFNLRSGDQLNDLAERLNTVFENIRSNVEQVEFVSGEFLKSISGDETPELNKLREIQNRLAGVVKKFKTH